MPNSKSWFWLQEYFYHLRVTIPTEFSTLFCVQPSPWNGTFSHWEVHRKHFRTQAIKRVATQTIFFRKEKANLVIKNDITMSKSGLTRSPFVETPANSQRMSVKIAHLPPRCATILSTNLKPVTFVRKKTQRSSLKFNMRRKILGLRAL